MKAKMTVTPGAVALARGLVTDVRDAEESARHASAVAEYRKEREVSATPWWVDLGGEGGPCG